MKRVFYLVPGIAKGYGLFYFFYMLLCTIYTRIFWPEARIIRLPYFIRVLGNLSVGKGFASGRSLRIDVHKNASLSIGANCEINDHCQIACAQQVSIGNNVLIASKVFITDHDHVVNSVTGPEKKEVVALSVTIEDNCWIGNSVSILKGVCLGAHCVVAAGSVVTKSFPAHSNIAGVPAKIIKSSRC